MDRFVISGTGCCLGDFMYKNISFESGNFKKILSRKDGDGGLSPGKLVFTEEFERFCSEPLQSVLRQIIGDRKPDTFNLGGPGIVAMINASQLLFDTNIKFRFFGAVGNDETGSRIIDILDKTPLSSSDILRLPFSSPFTIVLSDPEYDLGRGDRAFINNIGCAWHLSPGHLTNDFYKADMTVFGGTALTPVIHDHLAALLKKAKSHGCFTVVNTVYDFRHQKENPTARWPLGEDDSSYEYTDLLIMDMEEALRLSGKNEVSEAMAFFKEMKTKAFIITHGANEVNFYSSGEVFREKGFFKFPVSKKAISELEQNPLMKGDTTGCGDNFAGGAIASIARQLYAGEKPSLKEAVALGVASGGFCCYYLGGTYLEKTRGEKARLVAEFLDDYKKQTAKL